MDEKSGWPRSEPERVRDSILVLSESFRKIDILYLDSTLTVWTRGTN